MKIIGLKNFELRVSFKSSRILLVMQWYFNTPKDVSLRYVTISLKTKLAVLSINVFDLVATSLYKNLAITL